MRRAAIALVLILASSVCAQERSHDVTRTITPRSPR